MLNVRGDDVGQCWISCSLGGGVSHTGGQGSSEIRFKLLGITRGRIFRADAMKASAAEHDGIMAPRQRSASPVRFNQRRSADSAMPSALLSKNFTFLIFVLKA